MSIDVGASVHESSGVVIGDLLREEEGNVLRERCVVFETVGNARDDGMSLWRAPSYAL